MAEKKVVEAKKGKLVIQSGAREVQTKSLAYGAAVQKKVVEPKTREVVKQSPKAKSGNKVKLQQVASGAGHAKSQIATLKGLNLNKVGKIVELEDTSAVRGMIEKVKHLLRIFR